jgi:hypothetical protein
MTASACHEDFPKSSHYFSDEMISLSVSVPEIRTKVSEKNSPGTPDAINVTPSYLVLTGANAGTVAKGAAVNKTGIFAVLMDEDACGMTNVNEWSDTIWNPDGGYSNWFFHSTGRYWNSFTENAVVFTLD